MARLAADAELDELVAVEVRVRTGASDGRFTEIVSGEIKAGDALIVSQSISKAN